VDQVNRTAGIRRCKILLISANRCTTPEPVFPLGLAYLSAALRQSGHQVIWLDPLCADHLEEVLEESTPDLVGISLRNIDDVLIRRQETFVGNLGELVSTIRRKRACPVVLGGSGFSILPRELLELSGADYGIVGQGEAAFPALIQALQTGEDFRAIPGLIARQQGDFIRNASDTASPALQLEAGDWPQEISAYYLQAGGMLNVQTQRGCAHRCCYCTYPLIEGTRHRRRSPQAVVSEFEQLEKLGANYTFVVDSVFNSSAAHVTEICEALQRRKIKIRWGCFLRPQNLTPEMMRLMAGAGLAHIEFGSDSFCDKVLVEYQKGLTFEDIRRSTELARDEGIDFCHFVIAGGPGETPETLEISFKNSLTLGSPIIMAVPGMRIYPGTDLFNRAVAEGQVRAEANLSQPTYYLAPGLHLAQVLELLRSFAGQAPNWIVGDSDPAYEKLVNRLRQRGVSGPLWSYLATAQRLWPKGAR